MSVRHEGCRLLAKWFSGPRVCLGSAARRTQSALARDRVSRAGCQEDCQRLAEIVCQQRILPDCAVPLVR